MAKQHWSDDEIGRGATVDTSKELQLRKESEWSERQWKNKRITEKESQIIRGNQRDRNTLREYQKYRVTERWENEKER